MNSIYYFPPSLKPRLSPKYPVSFFLILFSLSLYFSRLFPLKLCLSPKYSISFFLISSNQRTSRTVTKKGFFFFLAITLLTKSATCKIVKDFFTETKKTHSVSNFYVAEMKVTQRFFFVQFLVLKGDFLCCECADTHFISKLLHCLFSFQL